MRGKGETSVTLAGLRNTGSMVRWKQNVQEQEVVWFHLRKSQLIPQPLERGATVQISNIQPTPESSFNSSVNCSMSMKTCASPVSLQINLYTLNDHMACCNTSELLYIPKCQKSSR